VENKGLEVNLPSSFRMLREVLVALHFNLGVKLIAVMKVERHWVIINKEKKNLGPKKL